MAESEDELLARVASEDGTTAQTEQEEALRRKLGAKDVAAEPLAATPEAAEPKPEFEGTSRLSSSALVIAGIWALLAVIFGIVLLSLAQDASYGGDAYTGIQNAVMLGVRGIAFLLFGSAAIGLVIATRRDR